MLFGSFICYLISFLNFPWFWRVPFIIGMFIGIFCTFIRKYLEETLIINTYSQTGFETLKNPLTQSLININLGIKTFFITSFPNVLFYASFFYFDILYAEQTGITIKSYNSFFLTFFILLSLFFGLLSEYVKPKVIMFLSSFSCLLLVFPIFMLMQSSSLFLIMFLKFILIMFVASFMSLQHSFLFDLWPQKFRCTGISIYFSLGGSVLGGTTPMILLYLYQITGTYYIAAFYLMVFSLLALISILLCEPLLITNLSFYKRKYS